MNVGMIYNTPTFNAGVIMNTYKVATSLNSTFTKGFFVEANSFAEAKIMAEKYLVKGERLFATILWDAPLSEIEHVGCNENGEKI